MGLIRGRKYGNIKTKADGYIFDSKEEANRYFELKMMANAGLITDLIIQPRYLIAERVEYGGEVMRELYYFPDFCYRDTATNQIWVEDVKSIVTAKDKVYRLKRHLFLARYGAQVVFVEIM